MVGSALKRSPKASLAVKSGMPDVIPSRSASVATSPLITPGTYTSSRSSRATAPSSTSWRTAVAVTVLVMLAIRTKSSARNGSPVSRSTTPVDPVHTPSPMRTAPANPATAGCRELLGEDLVELRHRRFVHHRRAARRPRARRWRRGGGRRRARRDVDEPVVDEPVVVELAAAAVVGPAGGDQRRQRHRTAHGQEAPSIDRHGPTSTSRIAGQRRRSASRRAASGPTVGARMHSESGRPPTADRRHAEGVDRGDRGA